MLERAAGVCDDLLVEVGIPLTGGNMSGVVRFGNFVHREAGAWTPTVHRLLRHLAARGITWVPRPVGFDEEGREILTFAPGSVPNDPAPEWLWAEHVIIDTATRLAEFHDATVGYLDPDAEWQLPAHQPQEVICHNDFVPYNMVFDDASRLSAVIDWDTASPGPRIWDLAYLAYRLVPLSSPGNPDLPKLAIGQRRRRLALLSHTYGPGQTPLPVAQTAMLRLRELADFTARRVAAGATDLADHVTIYRSDVAWLESHLAELTSEA
jgi:hypothetical protein